MWKVKAYLVNMGRNEDHFPEGKDRQKDLIQVRQMLKHPWGVWWVDYSESREKLSPHLSHSFEFCKGWSVFLWDPLWKGVVPKKGKPRWKDATYHYTHYALQLSYDSSKIASISLALVLVYSAHPTYIQRERIRQILFYPQRQRHGLLGQWVKFWESSPFLLAPSFLT